MKISVELRNGIDLLGEGECILLMQSCFLCASQVNVAVNFLPRLSFAIQYPLYLCSSPAVGESEGSANVQSRFSNAEICPC